MIPDGTEKGKGAHALGNYIFFVSSAFLGNYGTGFS